MKRNKGIDIFRTIAIMSVLIYHFYVLVGGDRYISYPVIHKLISLGGEIGVTLFFIISGYGIFLSIDYHKKNNTFLIRTFLKKRAVRILPEYYISLIIILLLTGQVFLISNEGVFHIVTHMLLIHNFFPSASGSLSTVLWTMGVIFQFYFIAPLLYKAIKKHPWITLIVSIVFTIVCKLVIYHIIFPRITVEPSYYFVYGRQLFSALDNFVVGMFLAALPRFEIDNKIQMGVSIGGVILLLTWLLTCDLQRRHTDTIEGYLWHSVLAVFLGIIMWGLSDFKLGNDTIWMKIILFVAKYQYGIYLWHFVVAANLIQGSQWFAAIANHSFVAVTILLSLICILVGYMFTIMVESLDYRKIVPRMK